MLVSLLAVFVRGRRVLLRCFVVALRMMVRGLMMVVGRSVVVGGGHVMMLARRMWR
jgi:hypothetical protein